MCTPSVRHALNTGEIEPDTLLLANLLELTLSVGKPIYIAETLEQIFRSRAALGRHGRIQLERQPDDLDGNLRSPRECSREATLPNEAPWANDVGKNFDAHDGEHTQAVA
jgi:hypothetical protein